MNVAYTVDRFGKNRRALEALQAQVDRQEYELEAARQTLAANVVLTSLRLAEAEQRLATAREIAEARAAQMEIAIRREAAGGISARELEAQGLVEFIDNPKHKTSKLVRATKKGHARFQSMRKQFLTAAGVYAPFFTASEVTMATDVCRRAREMIEV